MVLGAGFGGLTFCQVFRNLRARVTLVDRQNHHLFQPLLLDDALRIRREVLLAFERAENEPNRAAHERLLTIVVVGGGPTGLELAGAFAELTRHVLRRDFRHIDPGEARVILLEGGDRVLAHMAPELSASAQRQLETLGVEVRLRAKVSRISNGLVELADGTRIEAANVICAAGISAASMLLRSLSAVSQSLASKPMVAVDGAAVVVGLRALISGWL